MTYSVGSGEHTYRNLFVATTTGQSLVFVAFSGYDYSTMGRPKKPEGEVRDNVLRIRLTDEERALIDRAAAGKSLDSSAWARSELLALAKKLLRQKSDTGE